MWEEKEIERGEAKIIDDGKALLSLIGYILMCVFYSDE